MGMSALGDVIEQNYEIITEKDRELDRKRTLNMCLSGGTVGYVCHYTYKYLDIFYPGRNIKRVFKKVVLDQIICSPIAIATFFITMAVLERPNLDEFIKETKYKASDLYILEWIIWPPAQMVNFYFLSPKYRVLYDNTISLGFDIYLSYLKNEVKIKR